MSRGRPKNPNTRVQRPRYSEDNDDRAMIHDKTDKAHYGVITSRTLPLLSRTSVIAANADRVTLLLSAFFTRSRAYTYDTYVRMYISVCKLEKGREEIVSSKDNQQL